MSYEKYKDTIKVTNTARRAAVKILIDKHRAEFDELYLSEAEKRGLNPTKIKAKAARAVADSVESSLSEQELASAVLD